MYVPYDASNAMSDPFDRKQHESKQRFLASQCCVRIMYIKALSTN